MIRIRRRKITTTASLLTGFGVGAALAVWFAPKSGKASQAWIADKARRGVQDVKVRSQALREQAHEWASKGQQRAAQALAVGKETYREATSETQPGI